MQNVGLHVLDVKLSNAGCVKLFHIIQDLLAKDGKSINLPNNVVIVEVLLINQFINKKPFKIYVEIKNAEIN